MTYTLDIESSDIRCPFVGAFPFRFILQVELDNCEWYISGIELRDFGMNNFMEEWGMGTWFESQLLEHAYEAIELCISDHRADMVDYALESARYQGIEL